MNAVQRGLVLVVGFVAASAYVEAVLITGTSLLFAAETALISLAATSALCLGLVWVVAGTRGVREVGRYLLGKEDL